MDIYDDVEPDGWAEYGLGGSISYIKEHYPRWQKYDASLFKAMVVCAVCGFCDITTYDPLTDKHDFSNFSTAEITEEEHIWQHAAPHMKDYIHSTYLGNGTYECSVCKSCAEDMHSRKAYVVPMRPSYLRSILTAPLRFMQALSVVNVHLNLTRRVMGFYSGVLSARGLFHAPIFHQQPASQTNTGSGSNSDTSPFQPPSIIRRIISYNLSFPSSLYHTYMPFLERSLDSLLGFPAVSFSAISGILNRSRLRDPHLSTQRHPTDADDASRPAGQTDDIEANLQHNIAHTSEPADNVSQHTGSYTVVFDDDLNEDPEEDNAGRNQSKVRLLLGHAYEKGLDIMRRIYVTPTGLPSNNTDADSDDIEKNLTAEIAISPFLFPEAKGFNIGQWRLPEYLKFRFLSAFSAFTLYSPYLLIMFLILRTWLMAGSTTQACLKKDLNAARAATPWLSEEDLISKVIKHSIPHSLQGSPSYHKKHLDDLLCACSDAYYGMPTPVKAARGLELGLSRA